MRIRRKECAGAGELEPLPMIDGPSSMASDLNPKADRPNKRRKTTLLTNNTEDEGRRTKRKVTDPLSGQNAVNLDITPQVADLPAPIQPIYPMPTIYSMPPPVPSYYPPPSYPKIPAEFFTVPAHTIQVYTIQACIIQACIIQACIIQAHTIQACIIQAYITQAYITQAYITQAYMIQAYMIQACIIQAYTIRACIIQAWFIPVYMIRAYMIRAYVIQAYIIQAYLLRAYLFQAYLCQTRLLQERLPSYQPPSHRQSRNQKVVSGQANGPWTESLPVAEVKGYAVGLAGAESILQSIVKTYDLPAILTALRQANSYDIPRPPPELRLPHKHFESGPKIQRRIRPQLKTYQAPSRSTIVESSEDELGQNVHPVIGKLFNSLKTSLSAYDRSDCESSSWAQKLLGPPKKKKKRSKLDGFIVSSEDEADELDEISDADNEWMSPRKETAKTVIRTGDLAAKAKEARLTNAIVISGPHGCGKTAAVYAIAKELDYEVFEINASSRRSGKDVIEKLWISTLRRPGDPAATSTTKPNLEEPKGEAATPKAGQPSKSQKQSLILLEEVDVLYEEDKQFWVTIMTLIAQSKRPFVMTCNDENLVPLQSLSLHGIFRFTPPPTDLAVDAMLLIAANEGHALERRPVEDLYLMRCKDLRASLTDLNYWCQLGGDVVRVVSEGTYRTGMGCFARDVVTSCATEAEVEAELVDQTWEWWGVDCDGFLEVKNPKAFPARHREEGADAAKATATAMARKQTLASLDMYAGLIESMSAADILAAGGFGQRFDESIDATLPEINSRARDDFTLGRAVLDAPVTTHHCPLSNHISTATKCLARAVFRDTAQRRHLAHETSAAAPLNEASAITNIRAAADGHQSRHSISRMDMGFAFDPIAASDKFPTSALGYLDPSVFDRTMRLITLDVAPYVRAIVAFDERLKKERLRLGNLVLLNESSTPLSQRPAKRQRQTRAALSALEGGPRSTTRRERYFSVDLNPYLVMRTGGKGWQDAVDEIMEKAALEARLKEAAVDQAAAAWVSMSSPSPGSVLGSERRGRPPRLWWRGGCCDAYGYTECTQHVVWKGKC
ncbi:unnamed protein product [Parascedosporium putredinis]|uniref:AAA+ ATPase domain-containing protein n=1 Tax=Parascedosporium putredinis TaxID=1442378 RepID=A0A9P1HAE8_9PEZI|nr:unnamed protein product [Parascedosporium putredinis]CAI8002820.1 unnamed protein product [Parascedosporium putredinis]